MKLHEINAELTTAILNFKSETSEQRTEDTQAALSRWCKRSPCENCEKEFFSPPSQKDWHKQLRVNNTSRLFMLWHSYKRVTAHRIATSALKSSIRLFLKQLTCIKYFRHASFRYKSMLHSFTETPVPSDTSLYDHIRLQRPVNQSQRCPNRCGEDYDRPEI